MTDRRRPGPCRYALENHRELILSGKTQRWGYVSMMTLYRPGSEEQALEWSKELLKKAVPHFQFSARP